ncbi:radical SAM protein [Treponema endosymbiont of Eucomonympha sp.]|uniref:radical SAM protein n=1 Tax=Treponema endosymbiont of Eucomonympha sp. TaxID=1580831 RepID=UPI000782AFBB|nr:radical SAM protein [Treponema endosymbiont of Eucomonympha sp.]
MSTTKKSITRKSLIYKTNVEYGDYTVNHVQGCAHGCEYPCYAYLMAKRFGKIASYEEWIEPAIVNNALELLDKEIPKHKDKITSLHLCFTTDPFMYNYTDICELSIEIIKKINTHNVSCSVLTKGVLPKNLASLSQKNIYGITLISLDESFRERMEPHSAPYEKRIESLKELHDKGCRTWVSIEPYPTPNIVKQDFLPILESISFVDKIIFGRLNYNREVTAYNQRDVFYNTLAKQTVDFCNDRNIAYYIKHGTIKPAKDKAQ